ncbi:hypothetical protein [Streptomyces pseudogriseolus]|uniref:hypothetical protein n=1 Tax=Streptomyces pseudogriseolus TaxID=36817 RepID=UPI003FA25ADE
MTEAAAELFCEYQTDVALGDSPLEQGDVVQFLQGIKFPDGWHDVLGVVVTANCDLAREKTWGLITYVPAIPIDSYIRCFTVPKHLKSEARKAEKQLKEIFGQNSSESARRAVEMADLGYPEDQVALLLGDNAESKLKARFSRCYSVLSCILSMIENLETVKDAHDFWRALKSYAEQMDGIKGETVGTNEKRVRNYIKTNLSNPPGDVFFLSSPSPIHGRGYIVVLRFIGSINDESVALRTVDEMRAPGQYSARRVSRLETLYTHRVVQQMATVFTDIGLPEEYEQARDTRFDDVIARLGDH